MSLLPGAAIESRLQALEQRARMLPARMPRAAAGSGFGIPSDATLDWQTSWSGAIPAGAKGCAVLLLGAGGGGGGRGWVILYGSTYGWTLGGGGGAGELVIAIIDLTDVASVALSAGSGGAAGGDNLAGASGGSSSCTLRDAVGATIATLTAAGGDGGLVGHVPSAGRVGGAGGRTIDLPLPGILSYRMPGEPGYEPMRWESYSAGGRWPDETDGAGGNGALLTGSATGGTGGRCRIAFW